MLIKFEESMSKNQKYSNRSSISIHKILLYETKTNFNISISNLLIKAAKVLW